MTTLYVPHSRGLAATFADLENHCAAPGEAPLATPGSVLERTNAGGFRFYALQRYGHDGRRSETYLAGPVGDVSADAAAVEERRRIAEARETIASIRLLVREGYAAMGPKPFSVLAALSNRGIFAAGAVLVGTHSFDVIANRLGIRAAAFATEDLDVARPAALALGATPRMGFLGMLRESGVDLVEVPNLDPRNPPIKFKERGRSRFTVDLLVPTNTKEPSVTYVPELEAHATALPYLRYLLTASQPGMVLSRIGCAAVRVPIPERYALHKMLVAQLRVGRPQKSEKDIRQAATLVAALAEIQPGTLAEAYEGTPVSARRAIAKSFAAMKALLVDHPAAIAEMMEVLSRKPSNSGVRAIPS